ncbi:extracellular solute-binding protein [Paenibacillus sp. IB182496]|uniref:Maltodextrin-binding protein n=2 Tax=Paenibacillus sabuli TaxID=2772509 RepID=A0A927BUK4_9BACL|nr:extracellular solute-binding protein [Paenibacillus sabuli]
MPALGLLLLVMLLAACGPDRGDSGEGAESGAADNVQTQANGNASGESGNSNHAVAGGGETTNGGTGNSDGNAGGAGEMPEKPAQLTIWADENAESLDHLEAIAEKYTAATGIPVVITPIAMNDQPQALSLDGPAGKGPDLFYQPGIGSLAVQGLVQPIVAGADVLARYTPESLEALSADGELYGLPFVVETYALLYNKALIDKAPQTVAELEQLAAERTDAANDEYGFLYNATDFYFSWAFMGGSGGYIFGERGTGYDIADIGLNKEGTVSGVSLIQSWFDKGYIPRGVTGDIVGGLFNEGKVAAVINGPWAIADHRKQLGDDLAVAPLPTLPDGTHPQSFIGVKGWMLSAFSEQPEWASDLAAYLTNAESTMAWFEGTGETPPNVEVLRDPKLTGDPLVAGFSEQIAYGKPFPNVPELSHVWEPMANALVFASEGEDVQEVLDEAVGQIEDRIKMAGAQ